MKRKPRDPYLFSPVKKKILLLLYTGIMLGMTRSAKKQHLLLRSASREWQKIDKQYLSVIIREFKKDKLVDYKEREDGSVCIVISERGKKRALEYQIDEIQIPQPKHWDGKWRLVMFDIPEKFRHGRDVLREKLKDLQFYELQKSVWIHPFPCEDEITFIVEFFELCRYVRFGELNSLTLEEELIKKFNVKKTLTGNKRKS